MYVILSIATLVLCIAALVDIIVRDEVRYLPKFAWIILVVIVPLIGSIVWFAAGHDWSATAKRVRTVPADPTPAPRIYPVDTRSTEEQLAELDREIEEYERIRELEAKLEERRKREAE